MIQVYCDGSAHERAGLPGGWAYVILRDGELVSTGSGSAAKTTNVIMEREAALAGLREVIAQGLHHGDAVELVTDSRITLDAIAEGSPLSALCTEAKAVGRWVRAHSGDFWNEHVDALAHEAKMTRVPAKVRARRERALARRGVGKRSTETS